MEDGSDLVWYSTFLNHKTAGYLQPITISAYIASSFHSMRHLAHGVLLYNLIFGVVCESLLNLGNEVSKDEGCLLHGGRVWQQDIHRSTMPKLFTFGQSQSASLSVFPACL